MFREVARVDEDEGLVDVVSEVAVILDRFFCVRGMSAIEDIGPAADVLGEVGFAVDDLDLGVALRGFGVVEEELGVAVGHAGDLHVARGSDGSIRGVCGGRNRRAQRGQECTDFTPGDKRKAACVLGRRKRIIFLSSSLLVA